MMQTMWLLFVLFHGTPQTYEPRQFGPFLTQHACEVAAKRFRHTDGLADPRMKGAPMDAVCLPNGDLES